MIVDRPPGETSVLLLGVVRGLPNEVPSLVGELDRFRPRSLALTLSEEETRALETHFVGKPVEPVVPLSRAELAHAVGLARIAEVQVPAPAYIAGLEWAGRQNLPVSGVDPSEESYAEMFAAHIGYFELVRRTLRERGLVKQPPPETSADGYALAWERAMTPGTGSLRLMRARDEFAIGKIRELRDRHGSVAVLADRERFAPLRTRLSR